MTEKRMKGSGDRDLDAKLWDLTMKEAQAGWLSGPRSDRDVSDALRCDDWAACPRFPLVQKTKVRAIVDGSVCMNNGAQAPSERLVLGGVDATEATLCRKPFFVEFDNPLHVLKRYIALRLTAPFAHAFHHSLHGSVQVDLPRVDKLRHAVQHSFPRELVHREVNSREVGLQATQPQSTYNQ